MEGMDMQKLNFLISIILAFGLCFLGCQNSINPSESSESEQSGMEVLTCTNGNGNGDGCTLTPGYWKTHSKYGPAPEDLTWNNKEDDFFFYSFVQTNSVLQKQTNYEVFWTPPKKGNAYYILAHAYLAAWLNQLTGADFTDAEDAFDKATDLFEVDTNTPGEIVKLKGVPREVWIDLAEILDNYNNGIIGPGHCP
jgi:hypothetical protein